MANKNSKIREQLKKGAIVNAGRDLELAKDWLPLEEEAFKLSNVDRLNRIVSEKTNGKVIHKNLAQGRWYELTLAEQLGNIGSEVSWARLAQGKEEERFWGAVGRGLELFNLTLADKRWGERRKEIARAYEVFCDAVLGGEEYDSDLESLDRYFTNFGILAAKH